MVDRGVKYLRCGGCCGGADRLEREDGGTLPDKKWSKLSNCSAQQ